MEFSTAVKRLLSGSLLIALAGVAAAQQRYPSKPIRFILPNAPGGSNSFVARLVGEKLTADWGQQVIVDSRPGGNNVIAAEALLRSNPDGHTILLVEIARIQAMPDFKEKLA
ncbi:MAG: hypothetical protein HY322_09105 [Betaproteobacteria bacterium]|nr:hypothetical protein [Betaproteobacteria bacterium]